MEQNTAIVPLAAAPAGALRTLDPVRAQAMQLRVMQQQADILVKSGLLPRAVNTAEKAIAIQMMSRELGIGTWEGLTNIHVIEGTPTVSPKLHLSLALRSGQVESYDIEEGQGWAACTIKRKGQKAKTVRFTLEEARKAGLAERPMWGKYPANMLRWRAVGYCLDVTFPDLIGTARRAEDVGPEGAFVVEGNATESKPPTPEPAQATDLGSAEPAVTEADFVVATDSPAASAVPTPPPQEPPAQVSPEPVTTTFREKVQALYHRSVPAVWASKEEFSQWFLATFQKRLSQMFALTPTEVEQWEAALEPATQVTPDTNSASEPAASDDLPFEAPVSQPARPAQDPAHSSRPSARRAYRGV